MGRRLVLFKQTGLWRLWRCRRDADTTYTCILWRTLRATKQIYYIRNLSFSSKAKSKQIVQHAMMLSTEWGNEVHEGISSRDHVLSLGSYTDVFNGYADEIFDEVDVFSALDVVISDVGLRRYTMMYLQQLANRRKLGNVQLAYSTPSSWHTQLQHSPTVPNPQENPQFSPLSRDRCMLQQP